MIRSDYVPEERLWSLLGRLRRGRLAALRRRWARPPAAAIRALSLGKPLVVSDVGWFSELPDDVALKVPVGEGEVEALRARARAGRRRARRWARPRCDSPQTEHALDRVADLYAAALRRGDRSRRRRHESRLLLARCRRRARGSPTTRRCSCPSSSSGSTSSSRGRGRFRRDPAADVALYHVGNDAEAHGWIVEALRRRPGVVVLHDFVLHHLVVGLTFARGDAAGYLAAMEREAGLVGRLLAYAVLDNSCPPLWETRPEDFPLAGEVLELATGLIVHSRYVEERARATGYDGPIVRIPHPAWPIPAVAPATVEGDPLFGCFGHLNESKRIPQLARGVRAAARAPSRTRGCCSSARSPRGSRRLELPEGVERARTTSTRSGSGR